MKEVRPMDWDDMLRKVLEDDGTKETYHIPVEEKVADEELDEFISEINRMFANPPF